MFLQEEEGGQRISVSTEIGKLLHYLKLFICFAFDIKLEKSQKYLLDKGLFLDYAIFKYLFNYGTGKNVSGRKINEFQLLEKTAKMFWSIVEL